ncbi:MAG TPA: hypothetical protein VJH75_04655 [Patescibacteria group bacterium]|nr:hypothetical protein [Patescibacteria group bacterium]
MKTDTSERIAKYISDHHGTSAGPIITFLGHHPTGVFRHLHCLIVKQVIYKSGSGPKTIYFLKSNNMEGSSSNIKNAWQWAVTGEKVFLSTDYFCPTRDVFQARLDRLLKDFEKRLTIGNLTYLLLAAIGEIGNNSFDHNMGGWRDVPGLYFVTDFQTKEIILADRGRGILETLRRARPEIRDDQKAIDVALTEMVSGRFPEQRGNGLKYVKKIIEDNNLNLKFFSGQAMAEIKQKKFEVLSSKISVPGTVAIINF